MNLNDEHYLDQEKGEGGKISVVRGMISLELGLCSYGDGIHYP